MLKKSVLLLAQVVALAMCAAEEQQPRAAAANTGNDRSTSVALAAADGKVYKPLADQGQKATVLVFLMHDCPVTNASAPELGRIAAEYTPRGVQFFRVYATETVEEINTHGADYGLPFRGLLDSDLHLARIVGATRAPEAAVVSPAGELLYRGRIDDRAVKPGAMRPSASRHDLRLAIEAVLAGQKPEPQFTTSIGCYLPSK